jgi:glycosyltransferase involved in cell wall biosynthesis
MTIFIVQCLAVAFAILWFLNFLNTFFNGVLYKKCYTRHNNSSPSEAGETPTVSIVVVAHNNASALRENLPLLLEQDYPSFEVIVVNDNSSDDTEDVLESLQMRYVNLYHTFTPSSAIYISHGIVSKTIGIKAARYDWILFTKPDCRPESRYWIRQLASNFSPRTDIVLGYANYKSNESFSAKNIIFDRFFNTIYNLSCAQHGFVYNCDGCNLAFRKSLFIDGKGFSEYTKMVDGEDSLFINANATSDNISVECSPDSIIHQELSIKSKNWELDKLFYMETRTHFVHKFVPRLFFNYYFTALLLMYVILILSIAASVFMEQWVLVGAQVALYIIYRIFKTYRFHLFAKILGEHAHVILFPYYELMIPCTNLRFLIQRLFHRKSYFYKR